MEGLSKWIKGNCASTVLYLFQSKVDIYKGGKDLDKKLDNEFGDKKSTHLRKGRIMSMWGRFMLGFWHQNTQSLAVWYELAAKDIRRNLTKGGKK